jgi:hypothetical protein
MTTTTLLIEALMILSISKSKEKDDKSQIAYFDIFWISISIYRL